MKATWAELREAVKWSKSNYRLCGDYGTVRIGARVYLDGLYITNLEAEIERYDTALDEIGIYPRSVSGDDDGYEERTDYMNGWNACIMLIRIRLAELAVGKDFSAERKHILDECGREHNPELMISPNIWLANGQDKQDSSVATKDES